MFYFNKSFAFRHQPVELRALRFSNGWRGALFINNVRVSRVINISEDSDEMAWYFFGISGIELVFELIRLKYSSAF